MKRMLEPNIQQFESFIRSTAASRTWIYDPRDFASVMVQFLLPLASLGVTVFLSDTGKGVP